MSKTQNERVVVSVADEPVLLDLNAPRLFSDYKRYAVLETLYKGKKDAIRTEMESVVKTVEADAITYVDSKGCQWTATLVVPEKGSAVDEDKLKIAMAKVGKLNAVQIAQIFALATVEVPAKKSHVKITLPTAK